MKRYNKFAVITFILFAHLVGDGFSLQPGRTSVVSKIKGAGYRSSLFFRLKLRKGEQLGNVFSRTVSYHAEGYKETVNRVSGTCVYTVTGNDPEKPAFDCEYRYDGMTAGTSKLIVKNNGKTNEYDGKPAVNTDGSGLLFNTFIWGTPPETVKAGTAWQVIISQPWELGGPGRQTVKVLETDAKNHKITLQREGWSEGFYDGDAKAIHLFKNGKSILMNVEPKCSRWIGITVFQNGLVISDELMVTGEIFLSNDSLKVSGAQREYIILNAMPVIGGHN